MGRQNGPDVALELKIVPGLYSIRRPIRIRLGLSRRCRTECHENRGECQGDETAHGRAAEFSLVESKPSRLILAMAQERHLDTLRIRTRSSLCTTSRTSSPGVQCESGLHSSS